LIIIRVRYELCTYVKYISTYAVGTFKTFINRILIEWRKKISRKLRSLSSNKKNYATGNAIFFLFFRDLKLKQSTVNRLEEIEAEVKLESRQRLENEKEMRASLETSNNKVKLYTDECTEASRQMLSTEIETLRTRIQEVNEITNDLEIQFAELQTESKDQMTKSGKEAEGREKLLEAKIEDLSDRLRLGMGKLQQAIGESSASVKGKLATIDSTKIQLEDAEGLREKIRGEMNHLESQLVHLGSRLDGQQSVIEKQLRTVTF